MKRIKNFVLLSLIAILSFSCSQEDSVSLELDSQEVISSKKSKKPNRTDKPNLELVNMHQWCVDEYQNIVLDFEWASSYFPINIAYTVMVYDSNGSFVARWDEFQASADSFTLYLNAFNADFYAIGTNGQNAGGLTNLTSYTVSINFEGDNPNLEFDFEIDSNVCIVGLPQTSPLKE